MAKKLKGKVVGKKSGLKATLLVHQEQVKYQKAKARLQDVKKQKIESMKSGGKKLKQKQNRAEVATADSTEDADANGTAKRAQKQQPHQTYLPFTPEDKVLLIGDGDFSFAVSILGQEYVKPENLIVTSYDNSLKELELKYPHTALKNYETLTGKYGFQNDVNLFFKIDCTKLIKTFNLKKIKKIFNKGLDYTIFNFPHNGKGVKDVERNINDHQQLMILYFKNCLELYKVIGRNVSTAAAKTDTSLAGYNFVTSKAQKAKNETQHGKIVVSLFEGEPYDSWAIKELAKMEGLKTSRSGSFDWDAFPGYSHKRTNSEQETTKAQRERKARIYTFEPKFSGEDKNGKKRKAVDDNRGKKGKRARRGANNDDDSDSE